ncbi:AAA family ATPase [Haliscomenobacter hydrossis]|uniref:Uncharacterized protein n=1 Tax=Haliscomenobacter hydrossis (strain ATCC 27775 / DSM 1100 / LMG 10767 / O) TaxID=760192 RepID=F4KYG0_HALH1|nr:ATP-binding protein [Haliscomenobacter hydrossis]AEE49401.1 hypothetical protein Halhy_1509 [Haliscomenobacter hydrossis DSM 1100]
MSILRITELEMHQIGPFGDLTLTFPEKPAGMEDKAEIHILTGENGTGKSTVLEAMAVLFSQEAGKYSNKFRKDNNVSLNLTLSEGDTHFLANLAESTIFLKDKGGQVLRKNQLIAKKYTLPYIDYKQEPFGIAFFAYSGHRRFDHASIIGIKEIDSHPFEHALDFRQSIQPENILQWIANNIAGQALAQVSGNLAETEQLRQIMAKLESTISQIIQKSIRFQVKTKPYNVTLAVDQEELDFNQLPDGLKSIISWIADLLMRMDRVKWENDTPVFDRNFILFLDEIEVHMHPAWQRKVLPVVQRLFPNAQIFISTHSPFVVGSVDGAWIHKLVKPNGDSKLAEGYPILSEDEKSYQYWLEEVFGIHEKYGLDAQDKYERRRELIRKSELNAVEQEELIQLDEEFGTLVPEDSSLGQRIVEHLKRLKKEEKTAF